MMGELKYFLGFQVKQLQEGTFISQTKYIQDILNKFGMKDAKLVKTPMGTNGHLDLDTGGKSVDQKVYRSIIGSLLYLCASRPNIMLSVCMCARFQADPKEAHCWSEGRNATLRSKSPLLSRRSYRQSRQGHPSFDRHQTKTGDEGIPQCGLVQLRGPCAIRPIVTGPAWPPRVTGLICKGIPVITVCNPALWEYYGDNLGS
jgi:hypothetical protein